MKKLLSICCLLFFYTGCFTPYSYFEYADTITKESQLTNLPIKPTEEDIQIFFPGEKLPDEEYIKVDVLDASGSESIPTKALVEVLRIKAESRGMDAIIILGKNSYSNTYEDFGNEIYTVNTQNLSAVGIKYIKNIDYLDTCIRQARVISYNGKIDRDEVVTIIKTDWKGNYLEVRKGSKLFWNFLYNFSEQHLLKERKNWSFNKQVSSDGVVNLNRALLGSSNDGVYDKKVHARFFKNKVRSLRVYHHNSLGYSGKINFTYKDERLVLKEIKTQTKVKFLQEFIYDEDGSLLQCDIYKLEKEEKIFLFKVVYDRYKQEDLEKLLAKENVVGRGD